jgi:hypothetical protein
MAIKQSQELDALPKGASSSEGSDIGVSMTSLVKGATLPSVSAPTKIGRDLLHVPRGLGMKVLYDRDDDPISEEEYSLDGIGFSNVSHFLGGQTDSGWHVRSAIIGMGVDCLGSFLFVL